MNYELRIKKEKGFTLFELLVSISIIAILTAIASTSFSVAQKKARDSRRIQDMQSLSKAAEMFYSINGSAYPLNGTPGTAWTVNGQTVLESIPRDPKAGSAYTLLFPVPGSSYCFCADVEGAVGNSLNMACSFLGVGDTGTAYCVKNQQ